MATIQEFKAAWEASTKDDRSAAIALADQYVAENAALLESMFGGKSIAELCDLVSAFRQTGNMAMADAATAWELVKFPRQQIGGNVRPGGAR